MKRLLFSENSKKEEEKEISYILIDPLPSDPLFSSPLMIFIIKITSKLFLDFSEDSRFQLQPYLPENIPEDILSPEDTIFNEDEILTDIMPEVIPVYLEDQTPDRVPDIVADEDDLTEALENLENLQSMFYAPTNARRKRPSNNDWVILKDLEEKNDENVSTMDFDYNDSAASQDGDNDDTVYYGLDEPAAFETIFDRRERLDVKKPGPFFANSQNNFFLDKVI